MREQGSCAIAPPANLQKFLKARAPRRIKCPGVLGRIELHSASAVVILLRKGTAQTSYTSDGAFLFERNQYYYFSCNPYEQAKFLSSPRSVVTEGDARVS